MRIRAAAITAALLTSLILTACGTSAGISATGTPSGSGQPAGTSAPPVAPVVSASPSAEPTVAELNQQVGKARMATVTGARFSAPDRSGVPPLDVCGGSIPAYAQVKAVNIEIWLGAGVPMLKESVFGFQTLTGADVVDQARALAASCPSHTQTVAGETLRITRLAGPKVNAPPGVDAFYAFCETQTVLKPAVAGGVPIAYCTAVMGRGHVAAFLNAGQTTSLSTARSGIVKFLAAAAKSLVAAVPSG